MNFLNSHLVYSKPLKLGSHSPAEVYAGHPPKYRATEIDGLGNRARVANPSTLPNQVHGVVFPRGVVDEEYVAASLNNRKIGFSKMDIKRKKQTDAVDCSFAENFGSNDGDSVSSSVGSCSINNRSAYKLHYPVSADPPEDIEGAISDAESVSDCRYEEQNWSLLSEEELAAEIHRLELGAYRLTIEALHASGPLSWEQEDLITNLRMSLHISNDEHLMEIRNLISYENCIPIR